MYDALKRQLPEGWCAFHSLKLRRRDGEGEADFVIAIPERGLLVLEVKGGEVELRDGHWFQDRKEIRSPRDQAQGYVRRLAAELERRGSKVPFGVGCVFPDVEFSAGPNTGDLRGAVIGKRQLAYLAEALPAMAEALIPRGRTPPFAALREALRVLWGETWVPRVVLRDQVVDQTNALFALDAEQLQMLDFAGDNPRALVEGGAGTGKTVVARELCLRRAAEGQKVLYLCFTEALAQAIEQQFRQSPHSVDQLRAVAVRQYARELVGEEPPPRSADTLEFWNRVSLRAIEHLPEVSQRSDCVVVDEGQDFAEADWKWVEALAAKRALWIFHDPLQSFWRDRRIPEDVQASFPHLKLKNQQRCPEVVARFAQRFASKDVPEAACGARPEDRAALQLIVGEESELLPRLAATLDQLIHDGARPEEIAVLSLGGQKRSELQQLSEVGRHRLARCDAPEASRQVVADTFLRFKGLERPFVIVSELESGLDHRFGTRMHIALTRATVGVRILCTPAELDRDPRLRVGDPASS